MVGNLLLNKHSTDDMTSASYYEATHHPNEGHSSISHLPPRQGVSKLQSTQSLAASWKELIPGALASNLASCRWELNIVLLDG